ncbi:hypothetical protein ACS0TY_022899 [Phlomoides rotata]
MQASDRFNINSQLEHLQAKYVGTGHADLTRFEWAVNIHRDSYASYIGHYPVLAYFAVAENESIGRERYNFMQQPRLGLLNQSSSSSNSKPSSSSSSPNVFFFKYIPSEITPQITCIRRCNHRKILPSQISLCISTTSSTLFS